jgi:crossover junction endodeoxyribonuclease RuvC
VQKNAKIILGIDPGTVVMGYGLIEIIGSNIKLLSMGTLRMSSKEDPYLRLQKIHAKVVEIIAEYKPESCAIEAPFFGKNVQSMLKLGRAQGVAIAAAMHTNVGITEYAPRRIKQSITGNGNADKAQVLGMLQKILQFTEAPASLDATDAVAVALCHYYQSSSPLAKAMGGSKNWKNFISDNPGRVK